MTTQDISRIVAEMWEHARVLRKMRDDVAGLIADYNRPRFEQRDLLEQQAALHAAIDAMQFRAEAIAQQPSNAAPDGRAWTGSKTELLPGGALLIHDPVKLDSVIDWLERNPNCLMFHPFNHPTRAWSVAPSSRRNNDVTP